MDSSIFLDNTVLSDNLLMFAGKTQSISLYYFILSFFEDQKLVKIKMANIRCVQTLNFCSKFIINMVVDNIFILGIIHKKHE